MMRLPTVVVRGDVLTSWLTVAGYSRSRLAAELGVSKGRVSQLLTSREGPSAHLMARLMTLTRMPFDRLFKIVREAPVAIPSSLSSSTTHTGNGSQKKAAKTKENEAVLQAS